MSVLFELVRGAGSTRYVLRSETNQHQITRAPTIITMPGNFTSGDPKVISYDLGVVNETLTITGLCGTADEAVASGDPAYEAGIDKTYPGKTSLREAALTWWADVSNWAQGTGLAELLTPLGETYKGIIMQAQFNLEPARNYYNFSIVFRVASYE